MADAHQLPFASASFDGAGTGDPALAARVLAFRCDSIRNGRLASDVASLFAHAGLAEVHSERHEIVVRRPDSLDDALGMRDWAALAAARDLVSPAQARDSAWAGRSLRRQPPRRATGRCVPDVMPIENE